MPLDTLEKTVNAVADTDSSWWPFLWLRPHKHVPLSLERLCMLALLHGAPLGLFSSLVFALVYPQHRDHAVLVALGFPMLLLLVATGIIGPMWNRRAKRLHNRLRRAP